MYGQAGQLMSPSEPMPARRATDSDPLWMRATKAFGIPGIIALGLVYLIGTTFIGDLRTIRDDQVRVIAEMKDQSAAQSAMLATIKNHEASTQMHMETISLLLRQICVSGATDATERAECFRAFQR